jgi:uncharacterized protein YecE (DUF72 family)
LITHELRLTNAATPLREFLARVEGLGQKLGCLLIQLPPSLQFSDGPAVDFLGTLRELTEASVLAELVAERASGPKRRFRNRNVMDNRRLRGTAGAMPALLSCLFVRSYEVRREANG